MPGTLRRTPLLSSPDYLGRRTSESCRVLLINNKSLTIFDNLLIVLQYIHPQMSKQNATLLQVSRVLLRIWRVLNLAVGVLIVGAFVASFVFEPTFRQFFAKRPPRIDPWLLLPTIRVWMLLALPMIGVVHTLLCRLLEMVETVRAGDPFVPENAVRLKTIAWCLLGLQVLHLVFGGMAALVNAAGSNIEWKFSWTGWVGVVLVFVLAQVFEEGTRIRGELEGVI